ncbi:unnamed protein product [Allacma fusca]|uniref:Uncharacterized protein n=1 Tax=Allacma fusca TaxID=39272 RepID=A0A8J2PVK3_9HEXA|nr:unnamed protein product [Allacma fusca]
MGLNLVIPTSLCLEFAILIWQLLLHIYMQSSAAREIWYHDFYRVVNEIFFGVVIFMYLASFYWAFYFWTDRQPISKYVRYFRASEGFLLSLGAGIAALNATCILITIKYNPTSDQFEGRVIAGGVVFIMFTIIDACLYYKCPNHRVVTSPMMFPVVSEKNADRVILDGFGDFPRSPFFEPNIPEKQKY